jgi:hypothetical protein
MENENEIRKAFIFPDGVTHGEEKMRKMSCCHVPLTIKD